MHMGAVGSAALEHELLGLAAQVARRAEFLDLLEM